MCQCDSIPQRSILGIYPAHISLLFFPSPAHTRFAGVDQSCLTQFYTKRLEIVRGIFHQWRGTARDLIPVQIRPLPRQPGLSSYVQRSTTVDGCGLCISAIRIFDYGGGRAGAGMRYRLSHTQPALNRIQPWAPLPSWCVATKYPCTKPGVVQRSEDSPIRVPCQNPWTRYHDLMWSP